MEMVLDYNQIEKDPDLYRKIGGKGKNLFLLKKQGFNIPDFSIITFDVLDLLIDQTQQSISSYYESLNTIEQKNLISFWEKFTSDFKLSRAKEIHDAIVNNFGNDFSISVRSSVSSEDGKRASFAGLFKTTLNVTS